MTTENVEDSRPTVAIRVSGLYQYSRITHSSLRDLKAELASDDYRVQIPIAFPHATPNVAAALEHIVITISHGAATVGKDAGPVVLGFALRDIYDGVKRWLRDRFNKKADAPASYVTFLGPDGKPMKNILAKSADDIKEIDPPPDR